MKQTNFDKYLAKQLENPDFARRFKEADAAWDIAIQITELRKAAGLSQAQLARKLKTSQQQISRLESANYESHSLTTLRRVADALNAKVVVSFEPADDLVQVNEDPSRYKSKRKRSTTPRKAAAKKSNRKIGTPKKKSTTKRASSNRPTKKAAKKKAQPSLENHAIGDKRRKLCE